MLFKIVPYVSMFLLAAEAAKKGGNKRCKPFANGIVMDCGSNSDIFKIEQIKLTPSKPVPGKKLEVHFIGTLKETIAKGSYTKGKTDLNGFTVYDQKDDLCEAAAQHKGTPKCPVKPQRFNIRRKFTIPSFAPSGKYVTTASGYNQNKKRIFNVKVVAKI